MFILDVINKLHVDQFNNGVQSLERLAPCIEIIYDVCLRPEEAMAGMVPECEKAGSNLKNYSGFLDKGRCK